MRASEIRFLEDKHIHQRRQKKLRVSNTNHRSLKRKIFCFSSQSACHISPFSWRIIVLKFLNYGKDALMELNNYPTKLLPLFLFAHRSIIMNLC